MPSFRKNFPKEVLQLKAIYEASEKLSTHEAHALDILKRTTETHEDEHTNYGTHQDKIKMWHTIKKHETAKLRKLQAKNTQSIFDTLLTLGQQPNWVYPFIQKTIECNHLPAYFKEPLRQRKNYQDKIDRLSRELINIYQRLELNLQTQYVDSGKFSGFHVISSISLDLYGELLTGLPSISFTDLINEASLKAQKRIDEVGSNTKQSRNAQAIFFIKALVKRNKEDYETPLNDVVATLSNVLHGTLHEGHHISTLCKQPSESHKK